jgi:hypothetical protein
MALGRTIISKAIGAEDSREFCQKIGRNAQLFAMENYDCNKTAKSMIRFYDSVKRIIRT